MLPALDRAKVTGGGTVDWPGGRVTYGFTSQNVDDCCGAKGEFVIQARDVGLRVKADVISLAGLGNNAWLGCVVTQSSDSSVAQGGDEFIISVVDNGEGKNAAADQVSSCVPGSSDVSSLPLLDLMDWTNGNVQVHY